jgi:hypothetical protein
MGFFYATGDPVRKIPRLQNAQIQDALMDTEPPTVDSDKKATSNDISKYKETEGKNSKN